MSTFDGNVAEFPDIRIDNFRPRASPRPALVYFLSHVHSDHLVGLERKSFNGPFIYCSHATREILLKLEKYPHRMNFEKGILERQIQTYRHLKNFLKPIPLDTPTVIEYAGGRCPLRVTLIDANHCVGAVMFLIEGDGKAVLYTGDIRSEQWWVDSVSRNPVVLPYVACTGQKPLKRLDTIYLDTTFATKLDPYKDFPPKANGIQELLRKVKEYPEDTLFHFNTWTFGYEDVWQALASYLDSRIHIDAYRYKLYEALTYHSERRELASASTSFIRSLGKCSEAFKLVGAQVANGYQKGCLSTEPCRLHTCERGTNCEIWSKPFVAITPIISRYEGKEMLEQGAGGGQYDLKHRQELEIDDPKALLALCFEQLNGDPQKISSMCKMIGELMEDSTNVVSFDERELQDDLKADEQQRDTPDVPDAVPLRNVITMLLQRAQASKSNKSPGSAHLPAEHVPGFRNQITFPYSRHSSYAELCLLIDRFKPHNIFPCTVAEKWEPTQSMEYLFGHLYDQRPTFTHDQAMLQHYHGENEDEDGVSESVSPDRDAPLETQEFEEALQARHESGASKSRLASASQYRPAVKGSEHEHEHTSKRRRMESQRDALPAVEVVCSSPPPHSPLDHEHPSTTKPQSAAAAINHEAYCQPNNRRCRTSGSGSRRDRIVEETILLHKAWTKPSPVDQGQESPSRQSNRWQKLIAQSQAQKKSNHAEVSNGAHQQVPYLDRAAWLEDRQAAGSKRSSRHQSTEYGRLSPPPAEHEPEDTSNSAELSEDEFRLALKQQAYDAAQGNHGLDWSSISLVSVRGHQLEEEEL